MIPRVLHRVVPRETTPEVEEWWDGWKELHPDWTHVTWRDPLVAGRFESGYLWPLCVAGAQLAGLVRLEAVWTYGGIYIDSDMEPRRALDPLLGVGAFACREDEYWIADAFFGAPAEHPAIRACLDRAMAMMAEEPTPDPGATGPKNMTAVFYERDDVTVFPPQLVYPVHYTERARLSAGEVFPGSFAIHHWRASWVT